MDKFVTIKPNPGHEGNVSPEVRAKQYPGIFYRKLICRICNVVDNHVRKSVCEAHLKSSKHKQVSNSLTNLSRPAQGLANDICSVLH